MKFERRKGRSVIAKREENKREKKRKYGWFMRNKDVFKAQGCRFLFLMFFNIKAKQTLERRVGKQNKMKKMISK